MVTTMKRVLIWVVMFVLFVTTYVFAAIPTTLTYRGLLTDISGNAINQTVLITFSLYAQKEGGSWLWSEQQNVLVENGNYSVELGSQNALTLPFDVPYYLGIKVGNDQEMVPRTPLTSAPYALRAGFANNLPDNTVTTSHLVDGAVSAAKLGISCLNNQILVRSANGWGCGNVPVGNPGTITGVTAGNGLTGGGIIGAVQLDVAFGGNGVANAAARSDHDHNNLYQKKYGKVAMVAQSGGDYDSPAAALADVSAWCGIPSSANPCLVKLMPGSYSMGGSSLGMISFVDISGSGENVTTFSGTIDNANAGVINGASDSTLVDLTVKNSGSATPNGKAVAVYSSGSNFKMVRITADASGATDSQAILIDGGSANLDNVSASAHGPANNYGVYLKNGGSATILRSKLTGSTSALSVGAGSVLAADSQFIGGQVQNSGTISCANCYDASFNLYSCTPSSSVAIVISGFFPNGGTLNSFNPAIWVSFTGDINSATLNNSTIALSDQQGYQYTGTVTYDANQKRISFQPNQPLDPSTTYGVTLAMIRDVLGNPVAGTPMSWTFTTPAAVDNTPPTVVSVSPAPGSVANIFENVLVTFSEPIVNFSTSLTIKDKTGASVSCLSTGGYSCPVILTLNNSYTVTLSTDIKDIFGNRLAAPYIWSFNTAPIAPPKGVSASGSGSQATISWQPVTGATSYNLYWANAPFVDNMGNLLVPAPQVTKIAAVTSPAVHQPSHPPFQGTLKIDANGALPAGSLIGAISFKMALPQGTTALSVSPSGNITPAHTSSFMNNEVNPIGVGLLSADGFSTGEFLTLNLGGALAGLTPASFPITNVEVWDINSVLLPGITLTARDPFSSGDTYYYAVTAVSANGESKYSTPVSAALTFN